MRRTTRSLRFLALPPLVLTLPAASSPAPESAPAGVGFRGPRRDGVFPGSIPRRRPQVRWSFQTGGSVHGSPLWAGGLVVVGSGDGNLYALDAATGAERWHFATGGGVDGPAALAGDLVVFPSRDRNLYAVDLATGRERWRVALGEELPHPWGWDFYLSGPAVAEGRIFVGSGSGEVLAIDPRDGAVLWRHRTAGRVRSSPTVADGTVYVGSFDGHLYALAAASGELVWKFACAGAAMDLEKEGFDRRSIQGSPAVTADLVVVGARDGFLYGIERTTGRERWRVDHQVSWVVGSPAVAAGRAVVGSSDARFVHAVDLASGRELWRMRADGNTLSSPAIAGDTVVVGEGGGALLALDLATGRELWRVPTGDIVHSSPLVHEGVVYVGSDDGKVYALAGDLAAPARRAWRTVYFDARAPLRLFQGDRHLREALAAEGYSVLTRRDLGPFLEARIADREPSVVVFATDNVPTPIVDDGVGPALVRRYLDSGGRIVWPGTTPFLYTFDPNTLALADYDPAHVQRHERLLGVANDNAFVGECRAQATPLGAAWGLPAGWWPCEAAVSAQPGLEVLALDEHGHAAAWVKRYGAGGTFVRYWGRMRRLGDPSIVVKLAEHELP